MGTQQTFDQIRGETKADPIDNPERFLPNKVVETRLVFEPLADQSRVRVTARTADYQLLWGVIASEGMIAQHPVPVAFYEALSQLTKQHMPDSDGATATASVSEASAAAKMLTDRVADLLAKLDVKKVSDATLKRAALFRAAFRDALKNLESSISESGS